MCFFLDFPHELEFLPAAFALVETIREGSGRGAGHGPLVGCYGFENFAFIGLLNFLQEATTFFLDHSGSHFHLPSFEDERADRANYETEDDWKS